MKTTCDHCGGPLKKEKHYHTAAWCKTCVYDDAELLNNLRMETDSGGIIKFHKDDGELVISIPDNVKKMLAIPSKGKVAVIPSDFKELLEMEVVPVTPPEEKIDFHKYNSTLPGRRGTHS